MKEESAAEICSMLKSRYDQLVLTSGQTIDSLNSASENTKAEMAAEIVKHKKCRTRVEALELLQCSSLARESDLTSELLKVKEEFTAETEKCSFLKSDLTSELLSVKGEFTAEIEKCSILKSRYDQLVLTSGQTIDSLNSAIESTKAEMAAEIVKHGKCRTRVEAMEEEELKLCEKIKDTKALKLRVKTLEEDGAKLCEEFKDTKASLKLKNADLKIKQSKALISMKETHSSRVMSLESSLKSKNKGITKLEERVRVLQEETVTR